MLNDWLLSVRAQLCAVRKSRKILLLSLTRRERLAIHWHTGKNCSNAIQIQMTGAMLRTEIACLQETDVSSLGGIWHSSSSLHLCCDYQRGIQQSCVKSCNASSAPLIIQNGMRAVSSRFEFLQTDLDEAWQNALQRRQQLRFSPANDSLEALCRKRETDGIKSGYRQPQRLPCWPRQSSMNRHRRINRARCRLQTSMLAQNQEPQQHLPAWNLNGGMAREFIANLSNNHLLNFDFLQIISVTISLEIFWDCHNNHLREPAQ